MALVRTALFLAAGALVACSSPKKSSPPPPKFPACDASAATQALSFVHVNDLHSNYAPDKDGVSPYAVIRNAYLKAKAANPYTLFTSGGDEYEKGAVAEQLSEGQATRDILYGMKFDARVIGNHDYGWSEQAVLEDSRDPSAIVLSSNIHYTGTDPAGFGAKDYAEVQVGCVKIGFFGLTSGPWNDQDQYTPMDFYPSFPTELDYKKVASAIVAAHRQDVDLMIAVTHIGEGADEQLAKDVPGIDVILGGHSHTPLATPVIVNETIITQAGSMAGFVSKLDLTFDLKAKKIQDQQYALNIVLTIDPDQTPDPEMQNIVHRTLEKYAPEAQSPMGQLEKAQDTKGVALLAAKAAVASFHADAAIVDLGTVWAPLVAGGVSEQDFLNSFKVEREPPGTPGFNAFYTLSIDGASLAKARDELGADSWAVVVPSTIDPLSTYKVVVQKRGAFHPETNFPSDIHLSGTPHFESEAWRALDLYARERTAACVFMDSDASMPQCHP
jgi:2',3'-cyclic-nucleotide 2'-phosphodiesterase (5'-nucleotidase family)